jgi:hypothetical protein
MDGYLLNEILFLGVHRRQFFDRMFLNSFAAGAPTLSAHRSGAPRRKIIASCASDTNSFALGNNTKHAFEYASREGNR